MLGSKLTHVSRMGPRNSLQNKICNLPDWSIISPKFIFAKEGKLAGQAQVLPVRARGSALILKTAGNIKLYLRLLSFINRDIVQLVWIYIHGRQWLIHSLGPNLSIAWLARKHDFVDTTEMPLPWNMLYEGQITFRPVCLPYTAFVLMWSMVTGHQLWHSPFLC